MSKEAMAEQPAQQPVAWVVDSGGDSLLIWHSKNFPGIFAGREFSKRPLVFGDTSPPASKPLTDEETKLLWHKARLCIGPRWMVFKRLIEAAHGIKGDA